MSKSAFTVKAFGIYLLVLGVIIILIPNLLLSLFMMVTIKDLLPISIFSLQGSASGTNHMETMLHSLRKLA